MIGIGSLQWLKTNAPVIPSYVGPVRERGATGGGCNSVFTRIIRVHSGPMVFDGYTNTYGAFSETLILLGPHPMTCVL